jgi:membrane-anchored protein YejM (alkaline phosphatase superfamily)
MFFYLFGKDQYQKAYHRSLLLSAKSRELRKAQSDDEAVAEFIHALIDKRLPMFEFLLSYPEKNRAAILAEMRILKDDLNNLNKVISNKEGKAPKNIDQLVESVEIELSADEN